MWDVPFFLEPSQLLLAVQRLVLQHSTFWSLGGDWNDSKSTQCEISIQAEKKSCSFKTLISSFTFPVVEMLLAMWFVQQGSIGRDFHGYLNVLCLAKSCLGHEFLFRTCFFSFPIIFFFIHPITKVPHLFVLPRCPNRWSFPYCFGWRSAAHYTYPLNVTEHHYC